MQTIIASTCADNAQHLTQSVTVVKCAAKPKKPKIKPGYFINQAKARADVREHLEKLLAFIDSDEGTIEAPGDIGCIMRTFGNVLQGNPVCIAKKLADIDYGKLPHDQLHLGACGDWVWTELFDKFPLDQAEEAEKAEKELYDKAYMAWARSAGTTVLVQNPNGNPLSYVKYDGKTDTFKEGGAQ